MKDFSTRLKWIFDTAFECYGHQSWWPADTDLEICIGAILTQNTNWQNASRAINNLIENDCMTIDAISDICASDLATLLRPAGYYNQKAKKLKNFAFMVRQEGGSLEKLGRYDTPTLRNILLSVNGIGKETADDMLLYAFSRPVFVVDAYTRRILERHNFISDNANYDEIADLFISNLENSVELFQEYHALIVLIGKTLCKKANPKCSLCPLSSDLEENKGYRKL